MTSKEERLTLMFLDKINQHGGRHVRRLGPAIGPLIWKINKLAPISVRTARQAAFPYGGHTFKVRYSHKNSEFCYKQLT